MIIGATMEDPGGNREAGFVRKREDRQREIHLEKLTIKRCFDGFLKIIIN
jgi:hypothetical protein